MMEFSFWLILILPLFAALFVSRTVGGKAGAVLLKGSVTWTVLMTAVIGMESGGGLPMGELIVAAMAVFVLADMLLNIWFVPGMAVFSVGHGLLIWWIMEQECLSMVSIPIGVVLYALAIIFFRKSLKTAGKRLIPYLTYPAVLLSMAAMAVVLPVLCGIEYLPFAAGAALFVVSDAMVAQNVLVGLPKKWNAVAFGVYELSLFLITLSCWTI